MYYLNHFATDNLEIDILHRKKNVTKVRVD